MDRKQPMTRMRAHPDPLKRKLTRVLRQEFPKPAKIILLDGFEDFIHLYIISDKFKGKRNKHRGEMIWPLLLRSLTEEEWGRVSRTAGIAPDEEDGVLYPELVRQRSRQDYH